MARSSKAGSKKAMWQLAQSLQSLRKPPIAHLGVCPGGIELPRGLRIFRHVTEKALQEGSAKSYQHDHLVFILNLKTHGYVLLDGKSVSLSSGQCLLVHPYQVHLYTNLDAAKICWLFITFAMPLAATKGLPRDRSLPLSLEALGWLQSMVREWSRKPSSGSSRLILWMGLILEELRASRSRRSIREIFPRNDLLVQIHQKAASTEGDGWRIEDFARHLHYSSSHLRALFQQKTGLRLGQYLQRVRLSRAAAYLASGKLRMSEIAEQCGYESPFSFSRAFHHYMGVSPRDYRKILCN
jgi:AraC-like DNA-binding protein